MRWYEYLWAGLPLVLIAIGGAIGGVCGGVAFGINCKLFKSERSINSKYSISSLISVGAFIVYFAIIALIILVFPDAFKK